MRTDSLFLVRPLPLGIEGFPLTLVSRATWSFVISSPSMILRKPGDPRRSSALIPSVHARQPQRVATECGWVGGGFSAAPASEPPLSLLGLDFSPERETR